MTTTTTEGHTLYIKRYDPSDPRLGRHVLHDSRSLSFQVQPESITTLKSVRWPSRIPVLDQGNLGSCTGNATVNILATDQFLLTQVVRNLLSATDADVDEKLAVTIYTAGTLLDPFPGSYPPTDTGSNGLSVAKAAKNMGLISGYEHATSMAAVLTALNKGPCMAGTVWKGDMFNPLSDGRIKITGSVEGGHEYKLDELDVENRRIWMLNQWNKTWGINGRAYFTWDDFASLMADDGDCTVLTPLTQAAPTPTPTPAPAPKPQPSPNLTTSLRTLVTAYLSNIGRYPQTRDSHGLTTKLLTDIQKIIGGS